MKRLYRWAPLLAAVFLAACQFFAPGESEQTLVAQNQALSTEIAAIRATATVEADRMMITLEYAQTEVNRVSGQTDALAATLIARGTSASAIDLNAITPQAPVALSTPEPILDLAPAGVTPISITPGAAGADAPSQNLLAQNAPAATVEAVSGPSLSNIVTAPGIGSDDCAQAPTNTFNTDTPEIYVVALARQIDSQDVITSRWLAGGQEVISYDWSPGFEIQEACIWFFIDQSEVEFTPGSWSVQLELNGAPAGAPAAFSIVQPSGDAMIEDAFGGGNTPVQITPP